MPAQTKPPVPPGYNTVMPYLRVKGAAEAVAFYKKAFGAKKRILLTMGDQLSDLNGGYAERTFKLPNPVYYLP